MEGEIEGDSCMGTGRIIVSFFLFAFALMVKAQTLTDSNLPIVVIETDGGINIPDEPKVLGTMKIIWHQDGSRNYMTDIDNPEYLNYNGRIGIERRGSSSQTYVNKKPYAIETLQDDNVTNNNVSIFNMPDENDWILNSLAFDQTGMRDFLAYELSETIGQYASRRQYCEVVINGDYKGLYVFMEKIKPDKGRVNIEKMDPTCNSYPEVTGGYIVKADKTTGGDPVAWTMEGYGGGWWGGWGVSTDFILHYPKPADVTNTQKNYIHIVFDDLAFVANQNNISISSGIPSVIDIPSFVDFMMIAEFSSNVDVYSLSTFFHKVPNGSHLPAREALWLCSDSSSFINCYQAVPFGQFTRKLSNKSENLVLADAWGNVIDEVRYYDCEPWPTEPDGNGPYLELKNLDSDNSLAENWTFGDDLMKINELVEDRNIAVHPNPTLGKIHVVVSGTASRCQIIGLPGNVLQEFSPSGSDFEVDLSRLPMGMYLVKVQFADGRMALRKVIKQ